MNAFNLTFETFHNLDADPADTIQTVTDSAAAIRTYYVGSVESVYVYVTWA